MPGFRRRRIDVNGGLDFAPTRWEKEFERADLVNLELND